VKSYEDFTLKTHQLKDDWVFGHSTPSVHSVPVRCTDVERTLIDGLKQPRYCGGLSEVFRAWVRADPDPNRLVDYTERLDRLILYQRVGFVMETLGMQHAHFAQWKAEKSPRGGSRVLNPEKEYASSYSEEWNLSINHPTSILDTRDASYS
jgi:predicted transcriptional regulator of viral defense system